MEKKNTHIPYGFITGVIMVVVNLTFYLTNMSLKPGMQLVSQIPFLVGIILNAMAFSKANDGFVSFGNVFGSCFKMSMIIAIVMIGWGVICIFALPEMKTKAIEMTRETMAKDPKMTDEQMDMALNITKKYWNALMISGAIFGTLIYGAIFSLIGAAVAKKKGERMPISEM